MDNANNMEEKKTIADAAGLGDRLTLGECMTADEPEREDLTGDVPKCERIIEAVLFAAGHPVTYAKLAEVLGTTAGTCRKIVGDYADKYNGECGIERGVMLAVYPDSCQLCTKEDYGKFVREALGIRRGGNLSNTSLEVLAIIAYNQPVTRVYIDTVRGVDSSYTVSSLYDKGLIEPCGRLDVPGHPRLYRTTENFLRVFGLSSLSDLPAVSRDDILGEGLTEISGQYTIKTELAGEETGGGETE